jgi:hypothetical protein
MKNFFLSKINWSGIILILISIQSAISNQNFDGMTTKDWVTFIIGVLVVVFRTFFTSTQISK